MPSTTEVRPPAGRIQELRTASGTPKGSGRGGRQRLWRKYRARRNGGRNRPLRRVGPGGRCVQALRLQRRTWRSCEERNQMTIKVAINGFGRIGRMVLRAHEAARSTTCVRRGERPRRRADQRASSEVRHRAWAVPGTGGSQGKDHRRERRRHPGGGGARPGEAAVALAWRGRRHGMHRPFHEQGEGGRSYPGRRAEGDHLGAGREGRRPHGRFRR